MRFTEGVATCNQGNGFFVVHRHASKGLTNVARGSQGVWLAVWAFRVDVDQTHLHGSQGVGKLAIAAVAFVGQPFAFRAPINFFIGTPRVCATTPKAHRF